MCFLEALRDASWSREDSFCLCLFKNLSSRRHELHIGAYEPFIDLLQN